MAAQDLWIPIFQWGSFAIWFVLLGVALRLPRAQREYQWMLLAFSLSFPFEWLADEHWMFLRYDPAFIPMFGEFPLFMPAAWAWFFTIPMAWAVRRHLARGAQPVLKTALMLFVFFFVQDALVEGFFTHPAGGNLWQYHGYPASWSINGQPAGVPWTIPVWVGLSFPLYFFTHLAIREKALAQPGWWRGAGLYVAAMYGAGTALAAAGLLAAQLMGLPRPLPG